MGVLSLRINYLHVFFFLLGITFLNPPSYSQEVTFADHIAPIIYQNCSSCHQKNGGAPFPLIEYKDVAKRAKFIAYVTSIGYMPPWKADTTYRRYANEKILTKSEIDLIKEWVDQKTPAGDLSKIKFNELKENNYSVDKGYIFKPSEKFIIEPDLKEKFVISVVPFEFEKEQNVSLVDFIADNKALVHHANYGIFSVESATPIDGLETPQEANYLSEEFKKRYGELTKNLVYYNGYIPGSSPIEFPRGIGFVMPKRGVIVFTTHYAPSSVKEYDQSELKIDFVDTPIERQVTALSIGSGGVGTIKPPLIIPPEKIKKFKVTVETSSDLSLMYVWPHMHLLGKSFEAYAVSPQNDTIPLIRIQEWDFNWQEAYKLQKLQKIPINSVISVIGTYDNTSNNPLNPFNPPQTIYSDGYMETTDEMLSFIIMFVDYKVGDEQIELLN